MPWAPVPSPSEPIRDFSFARSTSGPSDYKAVDYRREQEEAIWAVPLERKPASKFGSIILLKEVIKRERDLGKIAGKKESLLLLIKASGFSSQVKQEVK